MGWAHSTAGELGNLLRVSLSAGSWQEQGGRGTTAGVQDLCATQNPCSVGGLFTTWVEMTCFAFPASPTWGAGSP